MTALRRLVSGCRRGLKVLRKTSWDNIEDLCASERGLKVEVADQPFIVRRLCALGEKFERQLLEQGVIKQEEFERKMEYVREDEGES